MAKKIENKYEVIDRMFAAVLSANESEATIKALRPQVEKAVREEHADPRCQSGLLQAAPQLLRESPGQCERGPCGPQACGRETRESPPRFRVHQVWLHHRTDGVKRK